MKSLIIVIALNTLLALSLTACSSDAKKTEAPKATEEKAVTAAPKAAVTKSNSVSKKADKPVVAKPVEKSAAATAPAGTLTCANGADSRQIEVVTTGTGCELMYTKNGEAKSIAAAKNEAEYCAGVSEKIVKNLTAAGFSCK